MRTRSFVPWVLVATTALGGVSVGPVLAQAIKEPGWPPPEGAACKPSKSDDEEARTLFQLGEKAENTSNYTDAIKYYKDSYKRACNKHLLLKNLGRVYEKDSQYAAAVEAYKMYRARGNPKGEELDLIDAKIANLSKKIPAEPTVEPTGAPTGTPTGAPTGTEPAPTGTAVTTATVAPTAEPTTPGGAGPGIAPWILTGVGGALAIGGGVLALTSNSTVSDKQDEFTRLNCGSNPLPGDRSACATIADDGNSAKSMRTVGWIVGGVGVAAVGAGLAWYFLGSSGGSDAKAAKSKVVVTPGPSFAGLGIAGVF